MMEYINELIVSKGNNSAYLLNYYDGYIQILTSWQHKNFQDDFNQRIDKYMVTVNKLEFIEYLQAMLQQILIYAYTIFIFVFRFFFKCAHGARRLSIGRFRIVSRPPRCRYGEAGKKRKVFGRGFFDRINKIWENL